MGNTAITVGVLVTKGSGKTLWQVDHVYANGEVATVHSCTTGMRTVFYTKNLKLAQTAQCMTKARKKASKRKKTAELRSERPATLKKCWALIEALDKRIMHSHAVDIGLLSDEHRKEFDAQNALLEAEGEDTLSVAEFLACRLEDATGSGQVF